MALKNKILILLAAIGIGFGIGYFTKPAKVVEVIKKEIVKEAAITKIVYREKIVRPDGTVIETERSREDSHTSEQIKEESSKTVTNRLGLNISALAYAPTNKLTQTEYGVIVSKRVVGNVTAGILATTDKKIGVTLGLEF